MGILRRILVSALFLAFAASACAIELPVLESLAPKPPKKLPEGVSVEGKAYHLRTEKVDVVLEPLLLPQVGAWFKARELENPFHDVPLAMNYIFLRVRFENLTREETVEFVPTACMFDTCIPKDESMIYEMFYSLGDGEKRLATLGKALYLKPLMLPPGQYIERLIFFEYDEPFPVKNMTLALQGVAVGRERVDLQYQYKATYLKKQKKKDPKKPQAKGGA